MPPESTRAWPPARRPSREGSRSVDAASTAILKDRCDACGGRDGLRLVGDAMYCRVHAADWNGDPAGKKCVALMHVGAAVSAAHEEADCDPELVTRVVLLALDRRLHETALHSLVDGREPLGPVAA
jgi:hypothetical protein